MPALEKGGTESDLLQPKVLKLLAKVEFFYGTS